MAACGRELLRSCERGGHPLRLGGIELLLKFNDIMTLLRLDVLFEIGPERFERWQEVRIISREFLELVQMILHLLIRMSAGSAWDTRPARSAVHGNIQSCALYGLGPPYLSH